MLKICLRYAREMPKICPENDQEITKIWPRYDQDMPKPCPRYAKYLLNILEIVKSRLYWGVSDHHKASPDPIFILKTSVCADGSQHLYETNRIHYLNTKSPRLFFGGHYHIFVAFGDFFMSENLFFWIFIMKNFLETHIFKCLTVQNNLDWQNQLNLVKQIWNDK